MEGPLSLWLPGAHEKEDTIVARCIKNFSLEALIDGEGNCGHLILGTMHEKIARHNKNCPLGKSTKDGRRVFGSQRNRVGKS